MRNFVRCGTRFGLFLALATMTLGLLFAAAPPPVHAAKKLQVVYPAGWTWKKAPCSSAGICS